VNLYTLSHHGGSWDAVRPYFEFDTCEG